MMKKMTYHSKDKSTRNVRKARPLRVYVLDDGSEWTVPLLLNKLRSKWKDKDIAVGLVRARLQKSTDPKHILCKPIKTKPKGKLTSEEEKDREWLHFALKRI